VRLLADENLDPPIIETLCDTGHEVRAVRAANPARRAIRAASSGARMKWMSNGGDGLGALGFESLLNAA
jgi:hypothetical protein